MKVICVVPARLASTRFPRKVLAKIGGKTLLEHVWLAIQQCPEFAEVYFAVDSQEVGGIVAGFGGNWRMTAPSLPTGTHRLAEFLEISGIEADVVVNWQADEPLISPPMIADLLQGIHNAEEEIWTLKKAATLEEHSNPNVVKVVTDRWNKALYFSRSPIPFDRDRVGCTMYKHIGLYAYTPNVLRIIQKLPCSPLSETEKLEQLAFLENGLSIKVYQTQYESIGVDVPQDLIHVAPLLRERVLRKKNPHE